MSGTSDAQVHPVLGAPAPPPAVHFEGEDTTIPPPDDSVDGNPNSHEEPDLPAAAQGSGAGSEGFPSPPESPTPGGDDRHDVPPHLGGARSVGQGHAAANPVGPQGQNPWVQTGRGRASDRLPGSGGRDGRDSGRGGGNSGMGSDGNRAFATSTPRGDRQSDASAVFDPFVAELHLNRAVLDVLNSVMDSVHASRDASDRLVDEIRALRMDLAGHAAAESQSVQIPREARPVEYVPEFRQGSTAPSHHSHTPAPAHVHASAGRAYSRTPDVSVMGTGPRPGFAARRGAVPPPNEMITPESNIGRLFERLDRRPNYDSDDPDDDPGDGYARSSVSRGKGASKKEVKVKVEKPKPYDGTPDLVAYNRWMRESLNYLEDIGASRRVEVRTIARFSEGKAQTFYQNVVASEEESWSLKDYFQGVFDACFPADFAENQRYKLEHTYQGSMSVKEYVATMKDLAASVGEVNERQKVVHLFRGLRAELQEACRKAGLSQEKATWDQIVFEAQNEENTHAVRARRGNRRVEDKGKSSDGNRNQSQAQGATSAGGATSRPANNTRQNLNRTQGQHANRPPSNAPRDNRPKPSSTPQAGPSSSSSSLGLRPARTPQERQQYQAEGRCYTCGDLGHITRNCSRSNSLPGKGSRPPGVRVNNIDFADYQVDDYVPEEGAMDSVDLAMLGDHGKVMDEEFSAPRNKVTCEDCDSDVSDDIESLCSESVSLELEDEVDEIGSRWQSFLDLVYADGRVGDYAAIAQTWMLEMGREVGFPGDGDIYLLPGTLRFAISRASFTHHSVYDQAYDRSFSILSSRLEDPEFNICAWYFERLRTVLDLEDGDLGDEFEDFQVDSLVLNTRMLLKAKLGSSDGTTNSSFEVSKVWTDEDWWYILDSESQTHALISGAKLRNRRMDLPKWYCKYARPLSKDVFALKKEITTVDVADFRFLEDPFDGGWDRGLERLAEMLVDEGFYPFEDYLANASKFLAFTMEDCPEAVEELSLYGIQVDREKLPAVQRNAAVVKDLERTIPTPVVVTVQVNGKPAKALIDSGSLGDFMSTTLADQLGGKSKVALPKPVPLQLAVQGSRSKINWACSAKLEYQSICEDRQFDVINIGNYDLILGTPWMYQHRVLIGLNPSRVVIGSDVALPIHGPGTTKLASMAVAFEEDRLEIARNELREYAKPLCLSMDETPLPPFRDINHTIPLIDEKKVYRWRPSKCPEPLREQWIEKKNAYLRSGRWKLTSAGNAIPMLHVYKPGTTLLRVVVDLRERNANTYKMATPMPDIEGILRRVARHRYRSTMDGKDAYEQIRVVPEHVGRTAMATPDGTMLSMVMQQGDCNAPATYQALMNHIFAPYIGKFLDVYLDDIIIYSDTLEEHIEHVKIVIDVLKREKLYLSEKKLHFLERELKILGHIVDDDGIRMDPNKVDSVCNWKVPTNRDLLRGFLGAVGFLADDVAGVRVPMGTLARLTGDKVPFRWEAIHQRAFDEVKLLVHRFREHRRKPLDYGKDAEPIWLITDASATGVSGVVSQGKEWCTARVAAFYSAKLNPAQQNYPVHELEMLAGLESMLRHRDILQGAKFTWLTDHKGLIHILEQQKLSGRQARWMEKMSEFDFIPQYIPGESNIFSDALSRIYEFDAKGTERAVSEFVWNDDDSRIPFRRVNAVVTGNEATAASLPLEGVSLELNMVTRGASARAFAERMRGKKFVLHGPKERMEGAGKEEKVEKKEPTPKKKRGDGKQSKDGPTNTAVASTSGQDPEMDLIPSIEPEPDVSGPGPLIAPPTSSSSHPPSSTPPPPAPIPSTPSIPDVSIVNVVSTTQKRLSGIDFLAEIRGKHVNDAFLASIAQNPSHFKNFVVENGLVYLVEGGRKLLCIPDVVVAGRKAREIVIDEGHFLLAHLGPDKTLAYLREFVWWKHISRDVYRFCASCQDCARNKPSNHRPYGLLRPLPVPNRPWDAIGIDFVGPLPKSSNRDASFDSVTVIIDLLTAMVHLVPSRTTYGAVDVAELVFSEVYKHHGLPRRIVSDRDTLFTSKFWQRLHELIGTRLSMSSSYHPQTDGSTERANRTVTQMLRQVINVDQKDWVRRLPGIEFAFNSARSATTGYAPFFLNSGRIPRLLLWSDEPSLIESKGVREFAETIRDAIIAAHDTILAARTKQVRDANRHRQPAPFERGDLVYVSTKNINFPQGLARKLIPKYMGPYRITRDFGNDTFRVELPPRLIARGIHPSFHASLLRIHVPNDDRLFPGRTFEHITAPLSGPITEWNVKEISAHSGKGEHSLFEITWPTGDKTWLPYHQVSHLEPLRRYFEILGISNIQELPRGTGTPPSDVQLELGFISPCFASTDDYLGLDAGDDDPLITSNSIRNTILAYSRRIDLFIPIVVTPMPYLNPHPTHTRFHRVGDQYHLRCRDNTVRAYPGELIALYFQTSMAIRDGRITRPQQLPSGYTEFALNYNRQFSDENRFNILGHRQRFVGPSASFLGFSTPHAGRGNTSRGRGASRGHHFGIASSNMRFHGSGAIPNPPTSPRAHADNSIPTRPRRGTTPTGPRNRGGASNPPRFDPATGMVEVPMSVEHLQRLMELLIIIIERDLVGPSNPASPNPTSPPPSYAPAEGSRGRRANRGPEISTETRGILNFLRTHGSTMELRDGVRITSLAQ